MKQAIHALCLLVAAGAMLASCLNSDEAEGTLYDDAAIETFTLGTLSRYYQPAYNPDTTLRTSVTGSQYKMTIDHLGLRIYNRDSLPMGTVPRVLCTLTTKNGSIVGLKGLEGDSVFRVFNSQDSVDFSQPRMFRVLSTDGTFARDYTVTLNVSQTEGVAFGWQLADSLDAVPAMEGFRLAMLGGRLVVFGSTGGQTLAYGRNEEGLFRPLPSDAAEPFDADAWQNVVMQDTLVYLLSGGHLLSSVDGSQWTVVAPVPGVSRMVGAGTRELFALAADGGLLASRDGGRSWAEERLDDAASRLPVSDVASVSFSYQPSDSTDYVLLAGTPANSADTLATVWRKISYYTAAPEKSQWAYMPNDPENRFHLPAQKGLSMIAVGGKVLAIGSAMTLLQSDDQGITWQPSGAYELPSGVSGTLASLAIDGEGSLWLLTSSGQLWQGRKR